MTETMIDAKTARRLTRKARRNRPKSNEPLTLVPISEVEKRPILREDFEVDWCKAIKAACKKGIGCCQVWGEFMFKDPALLQQITDEMEGFGYDFYHHNGSLFRIRWM